MTQVDLNAGSMSTQTAGAAYLVVALLLPLCSRALGSSLALALGGHGLTLALGGCSLALALACRLDRLFL